jgi:peptidoglycan/LPS O-acetylase OafA/YrhL
MENKETSNFRIAELDGLRGIAILLVISFHYANNQLVNSQNKIGKVIAKATSFGWIGVDLFFVLSGFLIGSVLLRSHNSPRFFSTFYIRRFLRIVPNYFLLIFCFIIISKMSIFANNSFLVGDNTIPLYSYFAMVHNFYMANLNSLGTASMSITWSIAIEEQFYIIFPWLLFFLRKRGIPLLLGAAILLAPIFRGGYDGWIPGYVLLNCRMDAIAFGVFIAWLNDKNLLNQFVSRFYYHLIGLFFLVIFLCMFLYWKYNDLGVLKQTFFSILFSIGMLFALTSGNTIYKTLLRFKPLVWVGTISYSLYLFHYLILGLFHHFNGNLTGLGINRLFDVTLSVAALLTSFLIAWVVYHFLEKPLVQFGKKFRY